MKTLETITENLIKHGYDNYEAGWHWFIETHTKAEIIIELKENDIMTMEEAKKYYTSWVNMVLDQEADCANWGAT